MAYLSGCGGPLSVVPYMASASLGAYETHKRQEEAERQKYISKCLPTTRPINALAAGVRSEYGAAHIITRGSVGKRVESQKKLVEAYVYYRIAETLGDEHAGARIVNIRRFMPAFLISSAEEEFERYTLENIVSCYTAS